MTVQNGIYRVVYIIPGSLGVYSEQIVYPKSTDESLKNVAKNKIINKASKNYNICEEEISIENISLIRHNPSCQSNLDDFEIKL